MDIWRVFSDLDHEELQISISAPAALCFTYKKYHGINIFFGHITTVLFDDTSLYHGNATELFCKDITLYI